jgi:hypothetical protein
MFFAYNNGITATASAVETTVSSAGSLSITYIKDFQIVNGGQTTASILFARDGKDCDLSKVFAQVKLSVVEESLLKEVVPKISEYANTQNKVLATDFVSNNPIQIKIERISKSIAVPRKAGQPYSTKWFYERVRGSYKSLFTYKSASEKKKLELEYPKTQLIEKTDLAKFGWTGGATGQYTIPFQTALIKVYQNRGQLPKNLQDVDLRTFIATADPALIGASAGAAGGPAPVVPQTTISNQTQAAAYANEAIRSLVSRDATTEEIAIITKALNTAESKNPVKTVNGKTTGGINRSQFILNLIKTNSKFKKLSTEIGNLKESKITSTESLLAKTAAANGLTLSTFADADSWVKRINQGESIENFKQIIRNTAKAGMPDSVKKLLDSGVDLDTVYSPYKQTMASILEINPDSISVNDPTLRMGIGADKEMPLYEYQRALKQDTRWQYTNNAKEDVSNSVQKVLRDFGFMG